MRTLSFALLTLLAAACQPQEVEMEPARTVQEVEADFDAG